MKNLKPPGNGQSPSIVFSPEKVALLFYIASLLTILNFIGIFLQKMMGYDDFFTKALVYFFDASLEYNIPALFSTLLLFIPGILSFIIYYFVYPGNQKHHKLWLLIGFIFLFLSIDEATVIHERFIISPGPEDIWTWIIPYSVFVLLVGIILIRFVWRLPARTRKLFFIAGGIYVIATMGFEPVENYVMSAYGPTHKYFLLCAVEEFLEMTGMIIFIYALLDYIALFSFSLKITNRKQQLARNRRKELAETRVAGYQS